MCAVQGCRVYADPIKCCLDDGILLGVHCPTFLVACTRFDVVLLSDATNIKTMGHVPGSTIVACGKYPFILDDHSTHLVSQAC